METVQTSGRQHGLRWAALAALVVALLSGCVHTKQAPMGKVSSAPAVLACSAAPESVFAGDPVTLTAAAVSIGSSRNLVYAWKSGDGKALGASQSVSVPTAGLAPGQHTVMGSVMDDRGSTASCTASFTIKAYEPATISCAASPSFVRPGEDAKIVCNAVSPQNSPLAYTFSADAGSIVGKGNSAILKTDDFRGRMIAVTAMVTDDKGMTATTRTTVRVDDTEIVMASAPPPQMATMLPPPPVPAQIVETGREFLLSGDHEKPGYGLYSYLLWWNNPGEQDRTRFLSVIAAFLSIPRAKVEEGSEMAVNSEGHQVAAAETVQPRNMNVAYIPVNALPPGQVTAEWVLDHYDVARARILLARVPKSLRSGPYIVSVLHPLRANLAVGEHCLFQNLSSPSITDDLAYQWIQLFQSQASQQEFWKPNMMASFTLGVRDQIGSLADKIPAAKAGLALWVQWISPKAH
jgi:hypothetical protein